MELVATDLTSEVATSYEDYVRLGRQLVKEMQYHQAKIAYYALQVCTIRHGGISTNLYTMKDYADDIGMKYKTLSGWVCVYRNVFQKLGITVDQITEKEWKAGARVAYIQEYDKRADNLEAGTPKKKSWSSNDMAEERESRAHIRKMYEENLEEPSFRLEAHNWNQSILSIKNGLVKRELGLANEKTLLEMMNNLDAIYDICENLIDMARNSSQASDTINNYLTKRKEDEKKKSRF